LRRGVAVVVVVAVDHQKAGVAEVVALKGGLVCAGGGLG
jgi:hypothetical protein